ncbi:hypothetical protein KFE25_009058 [Diacronema lutheri]|uniref:TLC domain-containing protein n=1 Tax=Diacronema lutheri TaxID=2081491 RepID=A0A8J5XXM8_DIALT|nr:hypothetical protein KFE25_009058 [Diacronema lutheri]
MSGAIPAGPVGGMLGGSAMLVTAGYGISYALARHMLRGSGECAWELADTFFHVPFVPLVLLLVVQAVHELCADVDARWHQATDETRMFLSLYVVQCSTHAVVALCLKRQVSSPAMYLAHHVVSVVCYGHALWTGRMHFWAVLAALCEVTNIFLNNLFLFRALKWDVSLAAVYKLNGVLLWLSYVAFRIVLFPSWLLLFARDIHAHPGVTWYRVNTFERYAYASTTSLLLAISAVWFAKITSGLVTAISGARRQVEGSKSS